jgi:large subunit ribosomal protein L17
MRHRNKGRKLGMDSSERTAMIRNMVTSVLANERVHTTEARAKEVRHFVEKVITLAKRAPSVAGLEGDQLAQAKAARVAKIRLARNYVRDRDVLKRLFEEVAVRFSARAGGYTRVIKTTRRPGDNASMAYLMLMPAGGATAESSSASEVAAE